MTERPMLNHQPVPRVSESDVARIVERDFIASEKDAAHEVLKQYGTEAWEREITRVRLAALKIASGDLEQLRRHVAIAKSDYRDVIAAAEYPQYAQRWFRGDERTAEAREVIISADWQQYRDWLSR